LGNQKHRHDYVSHTFLGFFVSVNFIRIWMIRRNAASCGR